MRKLLPKVFMNILLMIFFITASSQVLLKNSGWNKLRVAIAYYDLKSGWTTKGWFIVEPNTEQVIYQYSAFSNPNFYYCASIDNCDKGYYGNLDLFVDTKNAFTIPNANKPANYTNPSIKPVKFYQVNLKGRNTYTIDLKPINLICNNLREGKWHLGLDKEGDFSEKSEDAVNVREITFSNGQPIGWCKDFYNDGKIKSEFKLSSFQPFKYDGKCTWYKTDGSIEKEIIYKDGIVINSLENNNGTTTIKKTEYESITLPIQNFFINSTSNESFKGGASKTSYSIQLPENTIEWYYEFTTSRDENEIAKYRDQFKLASQLSSLIDKTKILSTSINSLTAPPGGNVCDVYLMNQQNANQYISGKKFSYYPIGSRINYVSGIVQVRNGNNINPVLVIKNNDGYYGIHFSVQVVAIISKFINEP